jgi:hypothetical protein
LPVSAHLFALSPIIRRVFSTRDRPSNELRKPATGSIVLQRDRGIHLWRTHDRIACSESSWFRTISLSK